MKTKRFAIILCCVMLAAFALGVAGALKVIAVLIYILSALAGVFLLNNDAAAAGWILLASGIVSGTLFLGFGEIIRLLDVISKK